MKNKQETDYNFMDSFANAGRDVIKYPTERNILNRVNVLHKLTLFKRGLGCCIGVFRGDWSLKREENGLNFLRT